MSGPVEPDHQILCLFAETEIEERETESMETMGAYEMPSTMTQMCRYVIVLLKGGTS